MPNFKIRRRTRKVEPQQTKPIVLEEKVDEMEQDMSEESTEELIDEALNSLSITKLSKQPPQYLPKPQEYRPKHNQPQYPPVTRPQRPKTVHFQPQTQNTASYDKYLGPSGRINDPLYAKPTMKRNIRSTIRQPKKARMRFKSHYGAHGEHLDTQTKTNLLYNHCFG